MKLKGVNAFEQHVEKIVLVAVAAVFLIVLAMQFLYEPNRVKITGTTQSVPPGKAFLTVEAKAKELQAQMSAAAENVLPQVPKYDLVNQLQARRSGPVVPDSKPLVIGNAPQIEGTRTAAATLANDRIQPLEVPPPAKVVAINHSNTFAPTEPINTPELKPLLPQEQPLDKHSVSVACSFDGTALKSSLTRGGGDGAAKAIPPTWYRDGGMEILAVKAERQEQRPDGSWSDAVEIAAPPGRMTLEQQLKGVRATADLMDVVVEAAAASEQLLRPDFYQTIAGDPFVPPTDAAAAIPTTAPKEVQDLLRKRKDDLQAIERLKKQKADLEKESGKAPRGGGGGGGGGGGKGSGGGGGGGGGGEGAAREMERQQKERQTRLDNFDKQIKAAEDRIAASDSKLKELGFDAEGKAMAPVAPPAGQPGAVQAAKLLLEDPEVRLWTHDLTVVPGKTYRYRVKVAVNNPAFARTSALVKEQQDLAGTPVVYSAPSEWSEPIHVMADQYYFVTSAAEADNLGPARATAEVFRFFYGYYRRGTISLEPGDLITTSIKLPDPNKLPIYDMTAIQNGVLPPAPGAPAPAAPPPAPRQPGGGGKGGGKGGSLAPQPGGDGERAGGGQQQPGQEATKVVLPPNSKPYSKPNIAAVFDLVLLDVGKALGPASDLRAQAYFRGDQGQIVVSVPEEQRKAAAYAAVAQSAKEGETQGIVTPTEKDPNKTAPGPKAPKPPTPPKVNPGGGGGGGTG